MDEDGDKDGGERRTIIAPATAQFRSALALLRVSGPRSIPVTATLTGSAGTRITRGGSRAIHYATITDPESGAAIDTVIVLVYRAPRSYTGEDTVEICAHGNPLIARAIIDLYQRHGIEMAEPGEFTLRALTNGKMDLTQAEAVREVIDAESARAREMALSHLSGALREEIEAIKKRLVHVAAAINIQLDYPIEESGDIEIDVRDIQDSIDELRRLIGSYRIGRLARNGVVVTLMGRTNGGKSSLFNRLLREERAIVSHQHGTTRDYLEAHLEINGIAVRLFDTAGIRQTTGEIEREGMARGERISQNADIILYVVDGKRGMDTDEQEQLRALSDRKNGNNRDASVNANPDASANENEDAPVQIIVLYNKSDIADDSPDTQEALPFPALRISAKSGDGIDRLIDTLSKTIASESLLSGGDTAFHADAGAIISSPRQVELLRRAERALIHAQQQFAARIPLDMLALDVEEAIHALGQITGEVSTADMLHEMFSGFCVGK